MDNSISIVLGRPEYGWLPLEFRYKDFHLSFAASDVMNDPMEELYEAVCKLKENEVKRTVWWLEPAAYFFDFERKENQIVLTISDTDDLDDDRDEEKQLITITGDEQEILNPFLDILKQFASQTFDEDEWEHKLDKNILKDLELNY